MADSQKVLQDLSDEYTKLQTDLSNNVQNLQKLESQRQENKSVKAEFENLDEDSKVYKLVGPVLVKQEKVEAQSTVDGRLKFIEGQIKDAEKSIGDIREVSEKKKMEIYQLQSQLQQTSAGT